MNYGEPYLSYPEYKGYGGTLDETPFNLLEYEARRKINSRTQGRLNGIEEIPYEVKLCTFSLINAIEGYVSTSIGNKKISSESIDGYSVTYATGNQIQEIIKSKNIELDDIIFDQLQGVQVNGTNIIYLGVL